MLIIYFTLRKLSTSMVHEKQNNARCLINPAISFIVVNAAVSSFLVAFVTLMIWGVIGYREWLLILQAEMKKTLQCLELQCH